MENRNREFYGSEFIIIEYDEVVEYDEDYNFEGELIDEKNKFKSSEFWNGPLTGKVFENSSLALDAAIKRAEDKTNERNENEYYAIVVFNKKRSEIGGCKKGFDPDDFPVEKFEGKYFDSCEGGTGEFCCVPSTVVVSSKNGKAEIYYDVRNENGEASY